VVSAVGWHAGYPGSILGREGLYTFRCIPQRFESTSVEILCYIKTFISFHLFSFHNISFSSECSLSLLNKFTQSIEMCACVIFAFQKGRFFSCVGLDGWMLGIATAGFAPVTTIMEAVQQVEFLFTRLCLCH
jgi:hypothetical protein